MNTAEVEEWLRSHSAPWPADADLRLTSRVRQRLELLPNEISGVGLEVVKQTDLPPWRNDGVPPLAEQIGVGGRPADEAAPRGRGRGGRC
jgi:hypothetical protein